MNAPATAGQDIIVDRATFQRLKRRPVKTIALLAVVLLAGLLLADLQHLGPSMDHPAAINEIGQYLCKGNGGLKRIHWRISTNRYSFRCYDGAMHHNVQIDIKDPQS